MNRYRILLSTGDQERVSLLVEANSQRAAERVGRALAEGMGPRTEATVVYESGGQAAVPDGYPGGD